MMAHQIKFFVLLLLILLEYSCFAARFLHPANFQTAEESQVDFICESDNREPIEECRFTVPAFHSKFIIFKGVINSKYEYVGEDLSTGQCGLRLFSIERANAGKVICSLEVGDTRQNAQTNVTVLYPFDNLKINSNNIYYEYQENDQMEFTCNAEGGFPAPRLVFSIGQRLVSSISEHQELTLKTLARFEHNGQKLECCAEQQVLHHSLKKLSRVIQVRFSPRIGTGLYNMEVPVVLGQNANVQVIILANPLSYQYELTKNGQLQDVQLAKVKLNEAAEVYTWMISKVQVDDIESDWRLGLVNEVGNSTIFIKLSSTIVKSTSTQTTCQSKTHDNELASTLSNITAILIVILMLVIIVVIILVIPFLLKDQIRIFLLREAKTVEGLLSGSKN